MKKLFLIVLLIPLLFAQERVHIVRTGDTLWDIAGYYYQNPFLWPFIYRANLEKINDPHWIYPDQEFVIPPSPEAIYELPPGPIEEVSEEAIEVTEVSAVQPERKIFTEPFIHRAGMILEEEWIDWGIITDSEPEGEKYLSTYNEVKINRGEGDVNVGDILTIFTPGPRITHPKTGDYLGNAVNIFGKVEITKVEENCSRGTIVASYDVINPGHKVIPYEDIIIPTSIELQKTDRDLEGYIVYLRSKEVLTVPSSIVFIDFGSADGISAGDIFQIYREKANCPEVIVGELQVLSTRMKTATAYLRWNRSAEKFNRGETIRLYMEAR